MIKSRFWPDKGIICERRKIEANGHKIPTVQGIIMPRFRIRGATIWHGKGTSENWEKK